MNSLFQPEQVADFGPVRAFVRMGPHLAERARDARRKAVSYRGFKVGAVALAASELGEIRIFEGANYKPTKESQTVCAEKAVIDEVKKNNFSKVIALLVSGPLQPDKHSALELPTLHPCGDCRELLSIDPVVKDTTFIMPVHPTHDTYELYSRYELEQIHASADAEDAPDVFMDHTDPGFRLWERGQKDFENLFINRMPTHLNQFSLFTLAKLAVTDQLRPLLQPY